MKKIYKKRYTLNMLLITTTVCHMFAHAELIALDEKSLGDADGQSGILIDAELKFNLDSGANGTTIDCNKSAKDCEMAVRIDGSNAWLVFYDVSGGIQIKDLKLDSSTVTVSGQEIPALAIGDTSGGKPTLVKFDDFGTRSIAIMANNVGQDGYRVQNPARTSGIDSGKPQGIVDLRINGDLEMTGGIKMFNCSGLVAGC